MSKKKPGREFFEKQKKTSKKTTSHTSKLKRGKNELGAPKVWPTGGNNKGRTISPETTNGRVGTRGRLQMSKN